MQANFFSTNQTLIYTKFYIIKHYPTKVRNYMPQGLRLCNPQYCSVTYLSCIIFQSKDTTIEQSWNTPFNHQQSKVITVINSNPHKSSTHQGNPQSDSPRADTIYLYTIPTINYSVALINGSEGSIADFKKCNPHKNVTLNFARSLDAYIYSVSNPHDAVPSQKKFLMI